MLHELRLSDMHFQKTEKEKKYPQVQEEPEEGLIEMVGFKLFVDFIACNQRC